MILAIPGSLAADSTNVRLLHAAGGLLLEKLPGEEIRFPAPFDHLPYFHPDHQGTEHPVPESVRIWRDVVRSARAILLSTPEYGHGVPGVLKNALDWIIPTGELSGKPLLLASVASTGGPRVLESLYPILTVMEARVQLPPLSFGPQIVRQIIDRDGVILLPEHEAAMRLRDAVEVFARSLA